ncbi:MAG TPA: hypothetical protein VGB16_03565, partial [candidate division Zixibacteria bacterium]
MRAWVLFLTGAILFALVSCKEEEMDKDKSPEDIYLELREKMVVEQIESRGVHNKLVLDATRKVPRHLFVPSAYMDMAYDDGPLPIGED